MIALNNAVHVALATNANLVLPKLLHHFDNALGQCSRISSTKQIADRYARVQKNRTNLGEYIWVSEVKTTTREHACTRTVQLDHACGWDPVALIRNRSLPSTACIRLGSTFIMRRPIDYSDCRIHVKERWKRIVRDRMSTFTAWDAAHLRLREGRDKWFDIEPLRAGNSSDTTPLVVITDDAAHATKLVANMGRHIVLAQTLFTKTTATEPEIIILDIVIAILARKFYPSKSSFSRFIDTQRRCSKMRI